MPSAVADTEMDPGVPAVKLMDTELGFTTSFPTVMERPVSFNVVDSTVPEILKGLFERLSGSAPLVTPPNVPVTA